MEELFLPQPPAFMDPGAICSAKVRLEIVKYNGDGVRPEGPKSVGNGGEVLGLPRAPVPSAVTSRQSEEIGVKNAAPNLLKWYFTL